MERFTSRDEDGIAYIPGFSQTYRLRAIDRLADIEDLEEMGCNGCMWKGDRYQKCTCCKRNRYLKDNYSPAKPEG